MSNRRHLTLGDGIEACHYRSDTYKTVETHIGEGFGLIFIYTRGLITRSISLLALLLLLLYSFLHEQVDMGRKCYLVIL